MLKIFIKKINLIFVGLIVVAISCVKDDTPADCTKPATPTVPANISVNEGGTIRLSATGVKGATYFWSGPRAFYADTSNPIVQNADIINSGKYWVKAQVGFCYSDSVATFVTVIGDSTCHLADNVGVFPNGISGPFSMLTTCTNGANNHYQINGSNADSSLVISTIFKQKPVIGAGYVMTDSQAPNDNEVYYQVRGIQGFFYSKGNIAYIKVKNGKVNIIVCNTNFPGWAC